MRSWRAWLIGAGFAVLAVVLSLSDRAPGILRGLRGPLRAIWRRIEIGFGFDSGVTRDSIPWGSDEIGHLVLWGGGMILLGLVLRHRRQADRIAVALFGASVILEILQALVTASRSLSLTDASANGLGVMVGLCVVVVVDLVLPTSGHRPDRDLDHEPDRQRPVRHEQTADVTAR